MAQFVSSNREIVVWAECQILFRLVITVVVMCGRFFFYVASFLLLHQVIWQIGFSLQSRLDNSSLRLDWSTSVNLLCVYSLAI